MTDDTQPEAREFTMSQYASKDDMIGAMRKRIAELESELEAIGAGGVSGPLIGRAALQSPSFDAADMATAPQQEAQEPVATLHCNDIGYVWARATEVGTRMRFEQPINLYTAPQPAPAPLSDDAKDAARWRMVVLIGNEVMLHPEKRTQAAAVKAYMDATHSGSDLTGAVDAALAAQGGK